MYIVEKDEKRRWDSSGIDFTICVTILSIIIVILEGIFIATGLWEYILVFVSLGMCISITMRAIQMKIIYYETVEYAKIVEWN